MRGAVLQVQYLPRDEHGVVEGDAVLVRRRQAGRAGSGPLRIALLHGADPGATLDAARWAGLAERVSPGYTQLLSPTRTGAFDAVAGACLGAGPRDTVLMAFTGAGSSAEGGALILGHEAVSYEALSDHARSACEDALLGSHRAHEPPRRDRIEDQATKVEFRLGQKTANLDQVMERVLSRVKIVEEALAIQTQELNVASDGAVAKLRAVENMVKNQADNVTEAAGRVEVRLAASADEFGVHSRTVTEKFDRATEDLEKASNAAIGSAEAMGQVSDTVIQRIDTVGERAREHAEQLANVAGRAAVQGDNIRETLLFFLK